MENNLFFGLLFDLMCLIFSIRTNEVENNGPMYRYNIAIFHKVIKLKIVIYFSHGHEDMSFSDK